MDFIIYQRVKLLIIILLVGVHINLKAHETPIYVKYTHEVIQLFVDEMEKELNLFCEGDGGRMPYDVEQISVKLVSYQRASIEQARELEVKTINKLVNIINLNEKIRPYLREYPFKENRIRVSISFNDIDDSYFADGSVAFVFQARNSIFYCAEDPITEKFIDLLEEPVEEAKKIVENQRN